MKRKPTRKGFTEKRAREKVPLAKEPREKRPREKRSREKTVSQASRPKSRIDSDGEIELNGGDSCGCGCLYLLVGVPLAAAFPRLREGALLKPAAKVWEVLLGIPLPDLELGRFVVASLSVLLGVGLSFLVGFGAGSLASLLCKNRVDPRTWGYVVAAASLLVTVFFGILSLII